MRKLKAVCFALPVRCGKGSIEETYIDVESKNHTKSPYSLECNDETGEVTVKNMDTGKELVVNVTNIRYREYFKETNAPVQVKRSSKQITQ